MASVLSTKLLSPSQINLLLNADLSLTEYNAIQTKALKFPAPNSEESYQHVIVTSQTTIDFIKDYRIEKCFCVGEKTAEKLNSLGFHIEVSAKNARELALEIKQNYSSQSFTFFGSLQRRPELSILLKEAKVNLDEVFVYETVKTPKTFSREFDAVLCFSPSGVVSFFEGNPESNSKLICIGPTTAEEAKRFTDNVFVSSTTSIESVIVKAVKLLKPKKSR